MLLKVPKVHVEEAIKFSVWLIFGEISQSGVSTLLNQTTRMDIYSFIKDNPGIHFRALSDCLNLPIGVLQYHLSLLVDGGLLSTYRDGRYKRYLIQKVHRDRNEGALYSQTRNLGKNLGSLTEKAANNAQGLGLTA